MAGDPLCMVCTPALCVHGEQAVTAEEVYQASLEEQLAAMTKERDALKLELATSWVKAKEGWRNLAAFEREILRAYRRSKKLAGYTPRPRKPVVVPP